MKFRSIFPKHFIEPKIWCVWKMGVNRETIANERFNTFCRKWLIAFRLICLFCYYFFTSFNFVYNFDFRFRFFCRLIELISLSLTLCCSGCDILCFSEENKENRKSDIFSLTLFYETSATSLFIGLSSVLSFVIVHWIACVCLSQRALFWYGFKALWFKWVNYFRSACDDAEQTSTDRSKKGFLTLSLYLFPFDVKVLQRYI